MFDSSRPMQSRHHRSRACARLLDDYDDQVGRLRLVARGISPTVASPLLVGNRDLATPRVALRLRAAMLPYLFILFAFIGGSYLAIDATAGERERQSLEPLLATPATREAILSGKILATAAFALAGLVVTLLAYLVVFTYMPIGKGGMSMNLPVGRAVEAVRGDLADRAAGRLPADRAGGLRQELPRGAELPAAC